MSISVELGNGKVDIHKLEQGTRVALDSTTKMIMRALPSLVDPSVATMVEEKAETVSWSDIGGLNDQIREIREVRLFQTT